MLIPIIKNNNILEGFPDGKIRTCVPLDDITVHNVVLNYQDIPPQLHILLFSSGCESDEATYIIYNQYGYGLMNTNKLDESVEIERYINV